MNKVQFSVFMQIDHMNASNNYQKGMQNSVCIVFDGFLIQVYPNNYIFKLEKLCSTSSQ